MSKILERTASLGGTPTSIRTTASSANVVLTIVMLLALPPLVYYMWFCLAFNDGKLALPSSEMLTAIPAPTITSVAIVAGWLIFQGLLQIYAPGKWVDGTSLSDGTRLKYKINGWMAWWITWDFGRSVRDAAHHRKYLYLPVLLLSVLARHALRYAG
jgi:hypothetical protein